MVGSNAYRAGVWREHFAGRDGAFGTFGGTEVSLLPVSSPLYHHCSGIVVLFAGWRVWRRACFPLLLMLLAQPLPGLSLGNVESPAPGSLARIGIVRHAHWLYTDDT